MRELGGGDKSLQNVFLSPDNQKCCFVKENNLFWSYVKEGEKQTQATFDGTDQILNGVFGISLLFYLHFLFYFVL